MKRISATLNRALAASVLAVIAASLVFAQGAPQRREGSTKGAVIKGKAPVNKEVLKVNLPKPYETKLGNGLQVVVLENHKLPTFAMQMVITSGGLADKQPGVAQFTASLLREGTKTRTSKQIAEQVDGLGASLSAGAGLSSLSSNVSASGLTDNFDQVMELFADVILNPTFPADEFNNLKTRTLAQIPFQRSQPSFLADEMFYRALYGNHPAARVSLSAADIQQITPEMLKQFHATYYKPNNATFYIVGDVKPAEVVVRLEKAFGVWTRGEVHATTIPAVKETGATKIYLIDRPGSVQTNLLLGNLTIERADPDYFALEVMNRVVGGGPSARLFLNLREDKGYTYGAYSSVSSYKYRGAFQASAEVRTDVTEGSMKEFMHELKRIRDEKVPAEEFENAKRSIIGGFALELESPQSLLSDIVVQKLYNLPADYWDTYPQKIAAVTVDDVQRVARKYLDLGKLQIVAVGDAKQIADVMKKFGDVTLYGTEGKPLQSPAPAASSSNSGSGGGTASLAGLAGLWSLTVNSPNGEVTLKLEIKPNGSEIGGALETPFGQFPVVGGSLNGSDVTIKVKADMQGTPTDVQIAGKLDGGAMKGQITSSAFPAADFTAKKEK
ncbi:MAG: M16 family metallopeptidase [Blastocatellales bacterium]